MWNRNLPVYSVSSWRFLALAVLLGFGSVFPSILVSEPMITIPVSVLDQIQVEVENLKSQMTIVLNENEKLQNQNKELILQKTRSDEALTESQSYCVKLENKVKWLTVGTLALGGTSLGLLILEFLRSLIK